jgi:uncharacterized protein (TIGR02145 family)
MAGLNESIIKMKNEAIVFFILLFLLTGCSGILFSGSGRQEIKYHGKRYKIISAGDQYWMSENLATETYRYGKKIKLITDYSIWPEMKTPGCAFYKNDTSNLRKYGLLYNWYAVDGGRLCPAGWRVASHEDWNILEEHLGGQLYSGLKMKAVTGWKGKHVSGDDIGFKALPGGYRLNDDFVAGFEAIWWTSSLANDSYFQKVKIDEAYRQLASSNTYVWGRKIQYNKSDLITTLNLRENGFSVRCVKTNRRSRLKGEKY